MHDVVDLRSDTVTRPTPEMRRAMAEAEVGDDVFDDDPTVHRLQEAAAARVGMEAALFVPTGTMANNVAIRVHAQPGDEILLDYDAHSLRYEVGAPAALSGVLTRQFRSKVGVPDPVEIADAIRDRDLHAPGTRLIVLENTHNVSGGALIPIAVHRSVFNVARHRKVSVHIDGARIFNASVASGVPVADFAACADSLSFCLSKGLGCPVGSLVCGTREFVSKARRVRKLLGGGMRQAGVLAACGLVALDTMVDRLADDHRNARRLAEGIAELPGIALNLDSVQTNMVYLDTAGPAAQLVERLGRQRVRCLATGPRRIRLVTHHDVDAEDIDTAIAAFQRAMAG